MALFTEQQIRARFESEKRTKNSRGNLYFSATEALNEGRITDSTKQYDIFLSHSSKDKFTGVYYVVQIYRIQNSNNNALWIH